MEWIPVHQSNITTDVAQWHNKEQIAYWKARALSLEYENRMLLQHLRNVYAKQTQDYVNYLAQQEEEQLEESIEENTPQIEESKQSYVSSPSRCIEKFSLPPDKQIGQKRRDEMEKLYGNDVARIMGMETAMQLNYDKLIDQLKPQHWPVLPLNLKFE